MIEKESFEHTGGVDDQKQAILKLMRQPKWETEKFPFLVIFEIASQQVFCC